jgi:hypothetical protein
MMNKTIKADRLDEGTWNRHRATIESLYWENSLDTIEAHMKKHHGFTARYCHSRIIDGQSLTLKSKSQYERHFRKWGLRKNLTTTEWVMVIEHLRSNSASLEEVEVLFKGREIPQKRVLQEIARRSSLTNTLHEGMFMQES